MLQLVADRVAIAVERARLHAETVLLDQLKAEFIAVASHELRTPASSAYGVLTTLASRGQQLSEELREQLLRTGVEQGERLRLLLEELLDLSRLDAHEIRLNPQPLHLRPALAEIVSRALAEEAPVVLEVPGDLSAIVDRLVLDRVISNLVNRDRELRIAVSDEGKAFPSSCSHGSSNASLAVATPGAAASASRSRARTRALTAETLSTTPAGTAHASSL